MNKLLEKTLRLAGVLLEDKDTDELLNDVSSEDDVTSTEEKPEEKPEEKKTDDEPKKDETEEKEESGGDTESFISETYATLREKSWAFVDGFFDDMAEEFNEDITNVFINGGEGDEDVISQITEKLADITKWVESKLSGESETKDEKDDKEEEDKDELDEITTALTK